MRALTVPVALAVIAGELAAQGSWNDSTTMTLVARAIARRQRTIADSGLVDFRARATGFVFFLGQLGEGLAEPPQLIKADQLALEVYWKAPNLSKQRILGWRERRDLPTDINYHRDHLGIVQNNFADLIRLGEGDEVRDVPHPLAASGPEVYDYLLADSLAVVIPQRTVRVLEIRLRPKDSRQPRVVGSLFVDAEQSDLVRMAFSFTPAAYLDRQLEDISIVLDHALWEGRYWLPYRQEIEIRRRATWLDLPARSIIRGRWEIEDYQFNLGLAATTFRGPEIVAAPPETRDTFPWPTTLDAAVSASVAPVERRDLAELRLMAADLVERYALTGLPSVGVGTNRLSELARANRVEGVALGLGVVLRPLEGRVEASARASYGFSDQLLKGAVTVRGRVGAVQWEVAAQRVARDVADEPPVSVPVNSVASQEFASDAGDYYLATGGRARLVFPLGARQQLSLEVGADEVESLEVRATPVTGAFRPNPPLGIAPVWWRTAICVEQTPGTGRRADLAVSLAVEAGEGVEGYWRAGAKGVGRVPAGATEVVATLRGGIAGSGLPAHRTFVLGGRGTLLGEPFRAYGGRQAVLGQLEWRVPVPWGGLGLGPYGALRPTLFAVPWIAAGWADSPVTGTTWAASSGVRPVAGIGLEWLRLIRVDLGVSLKTGSVAGSFDLTRVLWEVL